MNTLLHLNADRSLLIGQGICLRDPLKAYPKTKGGSYFMVQQLKSRCKKAAAKTAAESPLTLIHIAIGLSTSLLSSLGLFRLQGLLFHPQLVYPPRFQWWRIGTSFAVFGLSLIDTVKRAAGLFYWQAPLEALISQPPKVPGQYPVDDDYSDDEEPQWKLGTINKDFLKIQLLSMSVIAGIALFFNPSHRTHLLL